MRPRILAIVIALLVILSAGGGYFLFADSSSPSRRFSRRDRQSKKASKPEAKERVERDRSHRNRTSKTAKTDNQSAESNSKPKKSKKPEGKPWEELDWDKLSEDEKRKRKEQWRKAQEVAKKLTPKKATPKRDVHGDLPEEIAPGLKEGQRLDPRKAVRIRAGIGRPRQSRQGKEPGTKRLTPPSEGSVPEDSEATKAQLRPGLYTEIYKLNEPARNFFARNQEPTAGSPTATRIDNYIDFPDRESFQLGFDSDDFIVRWNGFIYFEEDTSIYLGLGNDIAGALTIDGQSVVVNDVFSWYVETWAAVNISAGYHRITIEHIEGNSHNDNNRNTACRLLYKTQWGANIQPSVVPASWFFQPEEIGAVAPVITKVSPQGASLEDDIIITGENLSGLVQSEDQETLLNSMAGVEVFIDGVPCELKSVAESKITAKMPAGAGSGDVEVRRNGIPSNRMPLSVSTRFGLVVSIWDLTDETLAMPNRPADFTILDDSPFPITRDKYSQFAGKPIAIRLEGQMAMQLVTHMMQRNIVTTSMDTTEEDLKALAQDQPGPLHAVGHQWKAEGKASNPKASVTLFEELELSHEFRRELGEDPLAIRRFHAGGNGKLYLIENQPLIPVSPYWEFYEFDAASQGLKLPTWAPLKVDLIFPLSDGKEDWVEPSFDLEPTTVHGEKRISHFKPNFIPPEAPIVFPYDEHYIFDGAPTPFAAPVDGELMLLVNKEAVEFNGPEEFKLSFFVDDVPASYQLGYEREGAPIDLNEHFKVIDGTQRAFKIVRVKIPDGAGDGMLRARMGIVQSDVLEFDVSNRGLVGFYYDFDEVLRQIPDVTNRLPIVRRIDKKLEFENNAIFNLPFPAERFSAEWYGQIRVPEGGEWTFIVQSDDGFRLKIGNTVVSEFPGLRPPRESSGKVTLKAGWHDLHIEFYENDVIENYVMWWVPPGKSAREKIPTKHYRTQRDAGIPSKVPALPVVD